MRFTLTFFRVFLLLDLAGGAGITYGECADPDGVVCALVAHSLTKTLPSSCVAAEQGATILHVGKCVATVDTRCGVTGGMDFVCGRSLAAGGDRTYDNMCYAEKDWAIIISRGRCSQK